MAVRLEGAIALRKALREFEPELAKELTREMALAVKPVIVKARGFVPNTSSVLTNWQKDNVKQNWKWASRAFDSQIIKKGITFRTSPSKKNKQGFQALASILNQSAAGAIFETAGRKHPWGQPWDPSSSNNRYSRSPNKYAGRDFIAAANNLSPITGQGNDRGRLIYRAWEEDHGKAQDGVIRAIEKAANSFRRKTAA